jgi:hypothetical protein
MADIPSRKSTIIAERFAVKDNTFKRAVTDNPRDKIEIEIGDSKQPDFKPQAKISRWDNEVNFSLRAEEHPEAVVRTEGKLIKYVTPDYEVHQYELDPGEIGEDGGLEFEWVLPKKPESNVLTATIQTKELNFFYQPALTQKEIDEGASRPENVVGSYAVYHKTKGGMNRADGMEYKTGKAFHIYRPKVTDKDGSEAWAELNIDDQAGVLSVTVPQEFLDKAVYPVIVDPTFGYTSVGGTSNTFTPDNNDVLMGFDNGGTGDYDAPAGGTVNSITYYGITAGTVRPILYGAFNSGSNNFPRVTYGAQATLTANNWTTLNVTSASITGGTSYSMGIWSNSLNVGHRYDTVTDDDLLRSTTLTYHATNAPANPLTAEIISADCRVSIYATYRTKVENLTDNFNDNSINATLWNDDNTSETGGQMVVTATTGQGTYNGIASDELWDLTESSAFIELVNAGDTSLSFTTYILELYNDTVDLYWGIEYGATDEIVAYKSPDQSTYTEIYRATYDSSVHKWFRIREASGTVYWDTSADGANWTNRASDATGYDLTALNVFFGVENPGSGSTTVIFDNFNHLTSSTAADVVTGTLSLPAPTVTAESGATNVSVDADVVTLTGSLPAPTVTGKANVAADVVTTTLSVQAPTITGKANVTADVVTKTLSVQAPTVTGIQNASTSADVVTLTGSIPAPTVTAIQNMSTTADVVTITGTLPEPTISTDNVVNVSTDADLLTTTLSAQSPTVTGIQNVSTTADVVTATLSLSAPTVSTTWFVSVVPDSMVLASSLPEPTVTGIQNVSTTADVITLTGSIPDTTITGNASVSADVVTLTGSIPAATITAIMHASVSADVITSSLSIPEPTLAVEGGYSGNASWGIDINTFGLVMNKKARIPTWTTSSRPTGKKGLFGFNRETNAIEVYNTTTDEWAEFNANPKITVSSSEPTSPATGDLWVDTS